MTAPIALFAYRRPDHLRATLESLSSNSLASGSHLYVFSDGPRAAGDVAAVESVRELVRDVRGFLAVTLVERPTNLGLANSVISGVSSLLADHDRVIVLEDDLVTSPLFLTYMNEALAHYESDATVFSVTGFSYPEDHLTIPADYPYDTFAGYRCCSFGWGIWKNRWQRVDWTMRYFPVFGQDPLAQAAFNKGGADMSRMLEDQYYGRLDSWAIRFCYAHYSHDMRCIYPIRTLLMNIGLDHSGTHSAPNPRFHHDQLDTTWKPARFAPGELIDARIASSFRKLFDPPTASLIQRVLRGARDALAQWRKRTLRLVSRLWGIVMRPQRHADVLFVSSYQTYGGAARAAWRLFTGIRKQRQDLHVRMMTLFREDADPDIYGLAPTTVRGALARHLVFRDNGLLARYTRRGEGYFSPARHANVFRNATLRRFQAQLVHLHWVNHSLLRIEELAKVDVPLIWTLHDAWPFTGGCHTPGLCTAYEDQCGSCPQLGSNHEPDLSRDVFLRKQRSYRDLNLTIVTPSRWLASLAKQSRLLSGRRIEVIPNGLDTSVFRPLDKSAARDYFGLEPDRPVILFAAHWLEDPNKGFGLLTAALVRWGRPCTLLTCGDGRPTLSLPENVQLRTLGHLHDDTSLALAYSAADVYVCSSRQENLPNTVAEALACATPCAAFRIGGLPEMIDHQVNGWLADPFDTAALAQGLAWLTEHPQPQLLREAARSKALAEYDLQVATARYLALYKDVLSARAPAA